MNLERWEEIQKKIKQSFAITDEYDEDLDPGQAEVLEFDGPMGKMKVRFVTKPKLLDKKTSYSSRIGSGVKVDYVFSDKEFVSHLEVFQWSDEINNWKKIEATSIF